VIRLIGSISACEKHAFNIRSLEMSNDPKKKTDTVPATKSNAVPTTSWNRIPTCTPIARSGA
jgi:hypothetical protein